MPLTMLVIIPTAGTPEVKEAHAPRAVDETAQYIQTLRPKMNPNRAKRLGQSIDYWAQKYDLDPDLMVALLRVESNFESGLKSCWPAPWIDEEAQTCDHGLAQINETWVRKWNLDPDRLVHDDHYNIWVQARLLAWLKRYFGHEEDWHGRYHSGTPSKKARYLGKLDQVLAQR
jgi:hypothetical protein